MTKIKIALLIFLLISVGITLLPFIMRPKLRARQKNTTEFMHISIGGKSLRVEVVRTPAQIEQGLSDRQEIGSDGMLFVMAKRGTPMFWMNRMQFNLDFVWIDGSRVVDLTENAPAPAPGTSTEMLYRYTPQSPITYVLELPAGDVGRRNIRTGDTILFGEGVR